MSEDDVSVSSASRSNRTVLVYALIGSGLWAYILFSVFDTRHDHSLEIAFIFAALLSLFGLREIIARVSEARTVIDCQVLVLVSFILCYPFSAIFHIIGSEGYQRGFYDIVRTGNSPHLFEIYYGLMIVLVAYIALQLGLSKRDRVIQLVNAPLMINRRLLFTLGVTFTILGVIGTLATLRDASSVIEGILTVNRQRELPENFARYVFLSEWFSWGITFLAVFLVSARFISSRFGILVLTIIIVVLITINLLPSGGRGAAVVSILPFLFILHRIKPQSTKIAVIASAIILGTYFVFVTVLRTVTLVPPSVAEQATNVFDWQLGRFSMTSLGFDIVHSQGFLWGSTLLHGVAQTINAPSTLMKLPLVVDEPRAITSIVGSYLLGDPEINGILPGSIAELYVNFGVIGVAGGFFVIGIMVNRLIKLTRNTSSLATYNLATYAIILICVNMIPGTASIWIYFFFTTGVPAIVLYIFERSLHRQLTKT